MEYEIGKNTGTHYKSYLPLQKKMYNFLMIVIQNSFVSYIIELRKKMMIEDMGCIIKSQVSNEFILHFPNHFDLRVTTDSAERRDDFLNLAKLRFAHLQPNYTLKVFGIVNNIILIYDYDYIAL